MDVFWNVKAKSIQAILKPLTEWADGEKKTPLCVLKRMSMNIICTRVSMAFIKIYFLLNKKSPIVDLTYMVESTICKHHHWLVVLGSEYYSQYEHKNNNS